MDFPYLENVGVSTSRRIKKQPDNAGYYGHRSSSCCGITKKNFDIRGCLSKKLNFIPGKVMRAMQRAQ